jgi:hypothetical protein
MTAGDDDREPARWPPRNDRIHAGPSVLATDPRRLRWHQGTSLSGDDEPFAADEQQARRRLLAPRFLLSDSSHVDFDPETHLSRSEQADPRFAGLPWPRGRREEHGSDGRVAERISYEAIALCAPSPSRRTRLGPCRPASAKIRCSAGCSAATLIPLHDWCFRPIGVRLRNRRSQVRILSGALRTPCIRGVSAFLGRSIKLERVPDMSQDLQAERE